jgi:hypothetical protein
MKISLFFFQLAVGLGGGGVDRATGVCSELKCHPVKFPRKIYFSPKTGKKEL